MPAFSAPRPGRHPSAPSGSRQGSFAWRWRRFIDIAAGERRLFLEAIVFLVLAGAAVRLVPCRWTTCWMGRKGCESPRELSAAEESLVRATAGAISRAARYTPWQNLCLPQALAAKAMLRRRGITSTVYLGVSRTGQFTLTAHAWTRSGNVVVTGATGADQHAPVASYADV